MKEPEKPKMLSIRIESEGKKRRTEDILRHLGMSKVKTQGNNHRKRLASQSRKSHNEKNLGDSHVYIIKLPANKYYYDHSMVKPIQDAPHLQQHLNHIPLSFKSNGKPGKIYHWNLPVVKKMMARKSGNPGPLWPKEEQPLQYRRVSYYKPKKPSKQAFHKYFPGNGRPHSLYIIERSRKSEPTRRVTSL
ncbi:hypothetical protein AAG570_011665 [Ranatra chinensis]|uniref:Uncharacterized protein n=1 Tax=Ranatra chinensis TaxID=642074 RepID=A0ABD0YV05_9HEMI